MVDFRWIGCWKVMETDLIKLGDFFYEQGNIPKALDCYENAIIQNEHEAYLKVVKILDELDYVFDSEDNGDKSFEYCKIAYEKRVINADYELGRRYFWGIGVDEDKHKALVLFKEAINKNKGANYYIGHIYSTGINGVVEKDINLAMEHFKNVPDSMKDEKALTLRRIGEIHYSNDDYCQARMAFEKAARLGDITAAEMLYTCL